MKKTCWILVCALVSSEVDGSSLNAQDKEATATATAVRVPATSVPKMGPLTVTVEMMGGQKITGTLSDLVQLPFRFSGVGEGVKIELSQVAGVKMASPEDPTTTVVFKSGDSLTGATELQSVSVDTEWGSAKINGTSITSIVLLPDLKWTSSVGLSGKRWSLVDSKNSPSALQGLPPGSFPSTGTLQSNGLPTPSNSRPVNPTGSTRVVSPN